MVIPDITIDVKDVIVRSKNQQEATAKQEGIPRIPVVIWNDKIM
jgi:hypothetical protein